jgi:hypothetical protein
MSSNAYASLSPEDKELISEEAKLLAKGAPYVLDFEGLKKFPMNPGCALRVKWVDAWKGQFAVRVNINSENDSTVEMWKEASRGAMFVLVGHLSSSPRNSKTFVMLKDSKHGVPSWIPNASAKSAKALAIALDRHQGAFGPKPAFAAAMNLIRSGTAQEKKE